MTKSMLIDAMHDEETRVVILDEHGDIEEFDFTTAANQPIKGNIFLAKITRVEPSLQAAFVEYGGGKQGFLPFSEIHTDYYQIPVADREKLQEEQRRLAEAESAEDDDDDVTDDKKSAKDSKPDAKPADAEEKSADAKEKNAPAEADAGEKPAEAAEEKPKPRRRRRIAKPADDNPTQAASSDKDDSLTTQSEVIEADTTDTEPKAEKPKRTRKPAAKKPAKKADAEKKDADAPKEAEVKADDAEPKAEKPKRTRKPAAKKAPKKADAEKSEAEKVETNAKPKDVKADADAPKEAEAKAADTTEGENKTESSDDETPKDEKKARRYRSRRGGRRKDKETPSNDDEENSNDDSVETIEDDDTEIAKNRSNSASNLLRRYKIQEVIKRNQIILVQVIKEERGNKGASLTSYISLPGRYCVLMPNSPKDGGISRKISRGEERKRLKSIATEMKQERGLSAIVRTAGIGRTRVEIKRDYEYLVTLWSQIREQAIASSAPAQVYEEGDLIKRTIRDYYTSDITTIDVQGNDAFNTAKDFMKMIMPSHAARVKEFKGDGNVFDTNGVEAQLQAMHQPMAKLKSGGYLIINPTEALVSIDVNSGRSTSERNVEETALKTNLEAAEEVAHQLRLRDLGGLVVIDFIDMYHGKNRRALERAFKEALKNDRAKIQVGRVSPFGLIEMSRQRLRSSLSEATTHTCPRCQGAGVARSDASLAMELVRILKREVATGDFREIRVNVRRDLALYLLNNQREHISEIQKGNDVAIVIRSDEDNLQDDYAVERVLHNGNIAREEKAGKPRRRSRKKNNNTRPENTDNKNNAPEPKGNNNAEEKPSDSNADNDNATKNTEGGNEEKSGSSRRRGGRGRYPRRGRGGENRNNSEGNENSSEGATTTSNESNKPADTPKAAEKPATAPAATATTSAPVTKTEKPAEKPAETSTPKPTAAAKHENTTTKDTTASSNKDKKIRKGWWKRITE